MDGRVTLVTGATSGLGLAAAAGLARLGASVRLLARNAARAEQARAQVVERTASTNVEIVRCDLSDLRDTAASRPSSSRATSPRRPGQQRGRAACAAGDHGRRGVKGGTGACDDRTHAPLPPPRAADGTPCLRTDEPARPPHPLDESRSGLRPRDRKRCTTRLPASGRRDLAGTARELDRHRAGLRVGQRLEVTVRTSDRQHPPRSECPHRTAGTHLIRAGVHLHPSPGTDPGFSRPGRTPGLLASPLIQRRPVASPCSASSAGVASALRRQQTGLERCRRTPSASFAYATTRLSSPHRGRPSQRTTRSRPRRC